MKIGIFYLATSVYKNYFDNFFKTVNNLFPEDEKELILVSDGFQELNNTEKNGIKIKVKEIIDLPYPLITANKFQMIKTYMEQFELEYAVYIDADTICLNKSIEFWNNVKDKIKSGKFLMSYHPHYLYTPNRNFDNPFIPTKMPYSTAYMNPQYINENKCYIITSFFMGRYNEIKKYADLIYKMIGADLKNIRWMPMWPDEAYMNKIYVDENILNNQNTIELDRYITINPYPFGDFPQYKNNNIWENNFSNIDTIFLNQKYDYTIKDAKKNNVI